MNFNIGDILYCKRKWSDTYFYDEIGYICKIHNDIYIDIQWYSTEMNPWKQCYTDDMIKSYVKRKYFKYYPIKIC